MKVIFVRHGESEANVADFINDNSMRAVNLTGRGREQAADVAKRLKHMTFSHAFASEFPRAQQTARIILQHHGNTLAIDARLNERKSGMDGLPTYIFNDLVRPDPINIRPSRGENFIEQTERLSSFLQSLESFSADAMVLAVSHEYPLRSVLTITGVEPERAVRKAIPNCGTVTVIFGDGCWSLVPELEE
jgi:broad specificity phosphatase PhoE